MNTTHKCLKEWNATIEALGQGKQTILIRHYDTNKDGFLLYPTFTYALKDDFLKGFQSKHKTFVENNALPDKEGDKVALKYYAMVEKIFEKSSSRIGSLKNKSIWTSDHVKNYLKDKKSVIVNLEYVNKDVARRIIDFISGAVHALNGHIQKVSNAIFLIAPVNYDIASDLAREEIKNKLSVSWLK